MLLNFPSGGQSLVRNGQSDNPKNSKIPYMKDNMVVIPLGISICCDLVLHSALGRSDQSYSLSSKHKTEVEKDTNLDHSLVVRHLVSEVKERGKTSKLEKLAEDCLRESVCWLYWICQTSPMFCDVKDNPEQMGKGNNEVWERQDSCHWVCLKHVEGCPEPNAAYGHCVSVLVVSRKKEVMT